jgi:hypothetical protein
MSLEYAFLERIGNCGTESRELVDASGFFIEVPICCDSRACKNPDCQKHRGKQFTKAHSSQIQELQHSMKKPKGWVFTGWILEGNLQNHRTFIMSKTLFLYQLLKKFSSSEFSIHCEIKPQANNKWYLHWHVVSGGVKDFKFLQARWGRYVKYETAIHKNKLAEYVAKYSSKVPKFPNEAMWLQYALTTYKLRLHRFSTKNLKATSSSEWFLVDLLLNEIKYSINSPCKDLSEHRKRKRHKYEYWNGKSWEVCESV